MSAYDGKRGEKSTVRAPASVPSVKYTSTIILSLITYGTLLFITLTVSLIAALIGWRISAQEHGGGQGGHD